MMRPPPAARMCGSTARMSWMLARQVRGEDGVDLVVGEFLGGAEDAVAGVADHDVDPPEVGDGALDDGPQGRGVADVEHLDAKQVGVLLA